MAKSKYRNLKASNISSKGGKKENSQIRNLEGKKKKLDDDIASLEKEYLAKIAKLLVMTQVHCEIKSDIYKIFEKLDVPTHVKEVNIDSMNQSFTKNLNNNNG